MLHLKTAFEGSSAHGLPRVATSGKPIYVRIAWLLLFLLFLSLFIRGFSGFVAKLQGRQVTSSLEASSERFQFPDVYVCFECPVSGTYSASMDAATVREFDARLNDTDIELIRCMLESIPPDLPPDQKPMYDLMLENQKRYNSLYYPQSLPYKLMVNNLAHRAEQSVISSVIAYTSDIGMPTNENVNFTSFYHPNYLRCFRWSLGSSEVEKLLRSGTSGGLVLSLMLDSNESSLVPVSGNAVATRVFITNQTYYPPEWLPVHVSDWTLTQSDLQSPDRRSGLRVFLTPPGEYPTDFAKSYLLAPGRHHVMEVAMTRHSYKPSQFDCLDNPPGVQFVNPYDNTSYSHEYSYSYCYYYEFHRECQAQYNLSGPSSPLPWPLRSRKFAMNLTGNPNLMDIACNAASNPSSGATGSQDRISFDETAQLACRGRDRCSLLEYEATISSADWPTSASLKTFLGTSVAAARASAASRGLAAPALDFLLANSTSASAAAAYVRSNLLKLQIRPRRVLCDRLLYAIDYGIENFISDVGGIMGIYLGMSLLTLCELIELIVDIARFGLGTVDSGGVRDAERSRPSTAKVDPIEPGDASV